MSPSLSLRNARIAAVVAVAVMLAVAHYLGILEQFADPADLKRTLVRLGPWGYVAFVVAFATLQPFGAPGTVFVWAAPMIWPWHTAFALSMTGTMAASVIGFSFCRFVARDWVASKVPARFKKYEKALERRAFATVFMLRFVFWMPQALHAFFGVSKVRFSTHFWGCLAGYALPLLVVSIYGPEVFDFMASAPPAVYVAIAAALVVIGVGAWLRRRRRALSARLSDAEENPAEGS